jgi:hypothetical protein
MGKINLHGWSASLKKAVADLETGGDDLAGCGLVVVVALENADVLEESVCAHEGRPDDDRYRGQADGYRKYKRVTGIHFDTPC